MERRSPANCSTARSAFAVRRDSCARVRRDPLGREDPVGIDGESPRRRAGRRCRVYPRAAARPACPPERRRATSPASTAVFSSSWRLQNRCFEPGRSEITTSTVVSPIRSGRRATLISASWPARHGSTAKAAPMARAMASGHARQEPGGIVSRSSLSSGRESRGEPRRRTPPSLTTPTRRGPGEIAVENASILTPTGGFLAAGYTHTINVYQGCAFAGALCGLLLLRAAQPVDHQGPGLGALRRQAPGRRGVPPRPRPDQATEARRARPARGST